MRGIYSLVMASTMSLAQTTQIADFLFPHGLDGVEHDQPFYLGKTAHICANEAEWYNMTTSDFAQYGAIVIPDPNCGVLSQIDFLEKTKHIWSPAVTGNIVLVGSDPSFHSEGHPGAIDLIRAALGFTLDSINGTGLYFALSCYYGSVAQAIVSSLSEFGHFSVRGNLQCYNQAHIVAHDSALASLDDHSLNNWSCSVHEVFVDYPAIGPNAFVPLAIANNVVTGSGVQSFADGSQGIPYIIGRGLTPFGCGNHKTEAQFGEECDNGDLNGTPGNPCSKSCRCVDEGLLTGSCNSVAASNVIISSLSSTLTSSTANTSSSQMLSTATSSGASSESGITSLFANFSSTQDATIFSTMAMTATSVQASPLPTSSQEAASSASFNMTTSTIESFLPAVAQPTTEPSTSSTQQFQPYPPGGLAAREVATGSGNELCLPLTNERGTDVSLITRPLCPPTLRSPYSTSILDIAGNVEREIVFVTTWPSLTEAPQTIVLQPCSSCLRATYTISDACTSQCACPISSPKPTTEASSGSPHVTSSASRSASVSGPAVVTSGSSSQLLNDIWLALACWLLALAAEM